MLKWNRNRLSSAQVNRYSAIFQETIHVTNIPDFFTIRIVQVSEFKLYDGQNPNKPKALVSKQIIIYTTIFIVYV